MFKVSQWNYSARSSAVFVGVVSGGAVSAGE